MGIASIILGIASFVFMFGGAFLVWVPILGPVLSFGAPILALAGCVTGGIGISRARQEGDSTGAATAGLIVSIIAFIIGLLLAVTCGFCGALCTAATFAPHRERDGGAFYYRGVDWLDAGAGAPTPFGPTDPAGSGSGPPPAFPPPPIQPGPGGVQSGGAPAPAPVAPTSPEAPTRTNVTPPPTDPAGGSAPRFRPVDGRRPTLPSKRAPSADPMPQGASGDTQADPMPQGVR